MKANIYIGQDTRNLGQEMAAEVCARSIRQQNPSADITSIRLSEMQDTGLYWREDDPKASTEFTYTRFLTPYLNNYSGYAIFCDSDFLWCRDIFNVLDYIDETKSVSVVQHEYVECPTSTKMDGLAQEWYPRKNWSSLMVFNCAHEDCRSLTPEVVNEQTPKFLHRLEWTEDENIGSIPIDYNYLVGYYNDIHSPSALHFTDGGPWHKNHISVRYSELWLNYLTEEEKSLWRLGGFWK